MVVQLLQVQTFRIVGIGPVHNITSGLNYCTIQAAVMAASNNDNITVDAGTYIEVGQILIDKNLTITGADKTTTFIKPSANTAYGGAWILVNPGITFNLSKVTLDGTGKLVYTGIKHQGSGTINDCSFTQIKYNESGPDYKGTAIHIESPGTVNVTNCMFSEIGRNGILADQCLGTYSGNMYTGKGTGDWLDYFILSEYGDNVTISNNTISNCLGIASVDNSGSSGIAVWDDPATQAIITGNTMTNNSIGVAIVGINGPTTDPTVTIGAGNLFDGGEYGVAFQSYAGAYSPNVTFSGVSTYKGQTDKAIYIGDGISAGVTFDISSAVFKTAGDVVITDNFAKEDLVMHAIDAGNRGLLVWNANNVYVTTNSFETPFTTIAAVQRGVDAASTGWTVNVADGIYIGDVNLNKSVTLDGQSRNGTILKGLYTAGVGATVYIGTTAADNAIVKDMTVSRDYQDWYGSTKNYGVLLSGGVNNVTLDNLKIADNRNGVYVENNGQLNMTNCLVERNRTGLHISNIVRGTVTNNIIRENQTHGVFYNLNDGTSDLTGFQMHDNNLNGNWYSQATFRGANVLAPPANLECNWYGTNAVTINATDPSELGYAGLIPQQLGGTSAQATYAGEMRGNGAVYIDYINWRTGEGANVSDPFVPVGMCNGSPVVISFRHT